MKAQIISFRCVLKNKLGHLISSTVNQDVLSVPTSHDDGKVLQGLSEGLVDLKEGEKRRISVSAERAYGFYDPDKVTVCSRDSLHKKNLHLGDAVTGVHEGKPMVFRVIELAGDEVTLDANHPLAGQDLIFEIEALDVREATREEVSSAAQPAPSELYH